MQDLVAETMRQILIFRPTERHIKHRIAELINLEYMKRVNPDVHTSPYMYVRSLQCVSLRSGMSSCLCYELIVYIAPSITAGLLSGCQSICVPIATHMLSHFAASL